jgi:hypothetical protein
MRGLLVNGLAPLSGMLMFAGAPAIGCDWGCWGGCPAYYAAPSYGYSAPAYGYSAAAYGYSGPAYGYSAPAYGYAAPNYTYDVPVNAYTAPPGYGYYAAPPVYYAPQPAAAYGPPAVSYPPTVYFAPTITNGPYFGNSARLAPSSLPAYAKRSAIARNGRQNIPVAAKPIDRGVKIKSTVLVNGPRNKGPNVRSDIRVSAPPLLMNGRLANNSFAVSRNVGFLPRRQLP